MNTRKSMLTTLILSVALLGGLSGCTNTSGPATATASSAVSPLPSASPGSTSPAVATIVSPAPSASSVSDNNPATSVQLLISAAASLTESLEEIKPLYEASHQGVTLAFNFGASGTLQKQIENGAQADLFLSAGAKQMKALVEGKFIDAAAQQNLLLNELVVVVPAKGGHPVAALEDLTDETFKKLAVGTPESVPAGSYTQETLEKAGLWQALQSKIVYTKDVKQVLNYVETGNTEAGFVYKTDALTSTAATIAYTVDNSSHSPITYPIGILQAAKHPAETETLYRYLTSPDALAIFVKHGFLSADAE